MTTKQNLLTLVFCLSLCVTTGCVSLGQKIDYNQVATIQRNITTESDIRAMFGEPVTSKLDMKRGLKVLTYGYKNDDEIQKAAAGTAGGVAGGVLGSQIGGGSGRYVAGALGSLVGGFLASNAVTARKEEQYLEVVININTHRVTDFNYVESKGRSQKIGVTSGVSPL